MTAKKPSVLLRVSHDIPLGGYYPLYQNSVDTFLWATRLNRSMCHFSRLKAAEYKRKKKFHPKSSTNKERQKYYDLILKRLEEFMQR